MLSLNVEERKSESESSSLVQKSKDVEYVFADGETYENFLNVVELRGHYTRGYQEFSIIPNKKNEKGLAVDAASAEKKSPAILLVGKKMVTGSFMQVNVGVGGKFDEIAARAALDSFNKDMSAEGIKKNPVSETPVRTNFFSCCSFLRFCCNRKKPLTAYENVEMTSNNSGAVANI